VYRRGIGINCCHRTRHRNKPLGQQTVAATDIKHVASVLRGDIDQPRVVGGVVIPVVAVGRDGHTNDCARESGGLGAARLVVGICLGAGALVRPNLVRR